MTEKQQESGFIFLNKYGERITTRVISGQLKKLAVRYNINLAVVYPHSFRHRFAKSFLERCNDIAFLADLMGHESIETSVGVDDVTVDCHFTQISSHVFAL